jgi:NAD(P)-dependent dehydrogenase (short-subunit alcohol dehydrogenase family)
MTSTLFDLSGKVAVVTGAAQGMGRAMATALADAGASLLLVDRNEAGVRQTPKTSALSSLFTTFRRLRKCALSLNGSTPSSAASIFSATSPANRSWAHQKRSRSKTWNRFGATSCSGRFCACQEAGRRMIAAGRGSIVNIGSIASVSALGRGHVAYSMAMGAVAQMTRELSTEWSSLGVRVQCDFAGNGC